MANPSETAPSSRRYMFIEQDANRSTSSEAIRVHVMRESHRARRQLRGLIRSQDGQVQMTILPNPVSGSKRSTPNRDTNDDSADQSPRRRSESLPILAKESYDTPDDLKRLAEQRLIDILSTSAHLTAALPGLTMLKQLPENIIELCGDDSAALHALLALIASVQQHVSVLQAAEYESSALEILRTRLADTDDVEHGDETILTVLLLSRVEVSFLTDDLRK